MFVERTGEELFSDECITTRDGKTYRGTQNKTINGLDCQAWSSQTPHAHSYDDLDYFPDKVSSIGEVGNFCRNLKLTTYDVMPWCLTTNSSISKAYCEIPLCKGRL